MLQPLKHHNLKTTKLLAVTIICLFFFTYQTLSQPSEPANPSFRLCWTFQTDQLDSINSASDNDSNSYHVLLGGKIISITSNDGIINWESVLGGKINAQPLITRNSLIISSTTNNKTLISSLNTKSGLTSWQTKLEFTGNNYLLEMDSSLLVISEKGNIFALNNENGKLIWNKEINADLSSNPMIFEDQLVFGIKNKQIIILSIKDGKYILKKKVSANPKIALIVDKDKVFWSDFAGNTYLLNLSTNVILWKFRSGAEISQVVATKDAFIIASFDNFIYKVLLSNGKLRWKKRFDGRLLLSLDEKKNNIIIYISNTGPFYILDIEYGKIINQLLIAEESFILNKPLTINNSIIVSTVKGLNSYKNSTEPCLSKKK